MKGAKRITWEDVLEHSNGGYDVFRFEIGNFTLSKAFHSPLRKDNNASFGIYKYNNIYYFNDLATGDKGTALQFVMKTWGLSTKEAIEKMAKDIGLYSSNAVYTKKEILWVPPVFEEREKHIAFSSRKWGKQHNKFYENTGVTESHALKYHTYAVKDAAVDRKNWNVGEDEVVWAYYAEDIDKVKLYFPDRKKDNKWRTNAPNSYLWNINNIRECERIIVQKSYKDFLITTLYTECVVAVQNESAQMLLEYNYETLNNIAKEKIISFGSDFQGWHESLLITYLTGWQYFNTPNEELPLINDLYGYSKKYGYEKTEELLKLKNII